MVHLVARTGQLANQLFRFAHHIANALEYNYSIKHHAFDYCSYFPVIKQVPFIQLQPLPAVVNKAVEKLLPILDDHSMATWPGTKIMLLHEPLDFSFRDKQFVEYAQQKRIVATNWLFRDYTNFNKHADTLRAYFEPEPGVRKKVDTYLNSLRASRSILVGVHIRRGDYRQWQNGRYCYPDAVYAQVMQSVVDLYGNDRVGFVLCSNEPINEENFRQFNVAVPRNTFIEDLTLLSGCDQIIGPPSSFSGWASFVGNTPLYHIVDHTKPLSVASFEVTMG